MLSARSIAQIVLAGFLVLVTCFIDCAAQKDVSLGISLPTRVRVKTAAGWWPTKPTAAKEQFVGNAACAKCHAARAASYGSGAMSHAAVRAGDSVLGQRQGSLTFQSGPYHYEAKASGDTLGLTVSDEKSSLCVPLTWAFGVGHMGQTYLYEQGGDYYESHVSYFAGPQTLDITPGQSPDIPKDLQSAPGRLMSAEETRACFGCHTTESSLNGKFVPAALLPGVTCEACHGPGLSHVAAATAGNLDPSDPLILNPGKLEPVDQVDFCGACHRTWEDVVNSRNLRISNVRFAPYRLENSKCWKRGGQRITCLNCHDPHKPLSHDTSSYDFACLQCHTASSPAKTHSVAVCKVAAKNCVTCHMPKYEPPGLHSSFIDHWIRVVKPHEAYPE